MKIFDVITIGSSIRDVLFYSDQFSVMKNPSKDPARAQLMCVEYGAKVRSDNVHFEFGGGAANTAVNMSGLGLSVSVLSCIGNDLDGRAIREQLERHGVNCSLLQLSKHHRTGFSFLAVDKRTGEHTAFVYYGAAEDLLVTQELLTAHHARWYYLGSLNTRRWRLIMRNLVAAPKTQLAWNPGGAQLQHGYRGVKTFLQDTDILIMNRDEATELCLSHPQVARAGQIDDLLRRLHSWGPKIVVITNAHKGSHATDGTKIYSMNAPQDHPVDTTGAGDCFGSSFVAGYIRYQGNIQKAMRLATLNATALVHEIGAQNGFLRWSQLPKALRSSHDD